MKKTTKRPKFQTNPWQGWFARPDMEAFLAYVDSFRYEDESMHKFLKRIRKTYNPGLFLSWEKGQTPDVKTLKEIWWNLRWQGCRFAKLMRLIHGVEVKEPDFKGGEHDPD